MTNKLADTELDLVPLAELPSATLLELSEVGSAASEGPSSASSDTAESLTGRVEARATLTTVESNATGNTPAEHAAPQPRSDSSRAVQAMPESASPKVERVPSRGMTRATKLTLLAALWTVSAAVPALVVWQVMRTSNRAALNAQKATFAYHARAAADSLLTPTDSQAEAEVRASPAGKSEAVASSSLSSATPARTSEAESSPAPAATAVATDPAIPTVVETESSDRVSVLLRTKPDHARLLRRGKEIGRTPLIIQIGRGERRVFEVAAHGFGAKRISIDGEKPEILVNMAGEAKAPGTVFLPAPLPEKKYERLR